MPKRLSSLPVRSSGASVLVVFPWCLDRGGHGNIQRILALARYLSGHGVAVDMVYQGNPGVPTSDREFSFCRRVVRVDAWRSSDDTRLAREFADFYSGYDAASSNLSPGTALTSAVRGLLDAVDYTAVLSTYAWTAPIFEPLARRALRIVDLQDILSLHGERSKRATGTTSNFSLPAETEHFLWRKWDVLLAITPEEASIVSAALRPIQRLLTVGHSVAVPPATLPRTPAVVYTGSNNPSNVHAVRWLLSEVWPKVLRKRPRAQLRLVGLICDVIRSTPLTATPNVELMGFVDQPSKEVLGGSIAVAPYLYGSGLKIKVLEAAGLGRPLVTTTSGLEGTGLVPDEHVMIGDTADDFAGAILELLDQPTLRHRLGTAARDHVQRAFSEDACYRPTLELIVAHAAGHGVSKEVPISAEDRLRLALEALGSPDVVVWGNGSHTRALVPLLQSLGVSIRCIVDKSATLAGVSAESISVVPAREFSPSSADLVVLSSQMFEGEMWADLEFARNDGVEVVGLYNRELVTDRLNRAMRLLSQRRTLLRPARSIQARKRRLIIAEPSAGRSRGPFLRLARALEAPAQREGVEVVVAGARRVALENFEAEDLALIDPTFEFAYWDMVREHGRDVWRDVARFARIATADLTGMGGRLDVSRRDVVLFHTANLLDVLTAGMWLSATQPQATPEIRFLFHFTPDQEAQWLNITKDELRHAYALAFGLLADRVGDGVQLLAQNEILAAALTDAFDRHVVPMGFPVPGHGRLAPRARPASPARVLFAGEARGEKGFGLLPGIAESLRVELSSGQIRLVCQTSQSEFADDALKSAFKKLASEPGIETVEGFLSSVEYDRLMAGCDLVLLPYDARQYESRLSAVFVDAAANGIPVVVPDGSWMSRQLADGVGAGMTFDALTPSSVADAIRRAAKAPSLTAAAEASMSRVWQLHDPGAVLAAILGRAGNPVTNQKSTLTIPPIPIVNETTLAAAS